MLSRVRYVPMARSKLSKKLRPYWGYLVLVALAVAVAQGASPTLLTTLSALLALYALFLVPVPCGAPIREEGKFCRNNSRGLLSGCHLVAHKWNKFYLAIMSHKWRKATRGMLGETPPEHVQGLAAIVTILAPLVGFATALVNAVTH